MTTARQIAANRRNARKSTGPRTERGKHNSRQNALRHGLTAETVIVGLKEGLEYNSFETSILADLAPQSTLEQELALQLASLLWRLRRATLVETGLFQIQREILREHVEATPASPLNLPTKHPWIEPQSLRVLPQTLHMACPETNPDGSNVPEPRSANGRARFPVNGKERIAAQGSSCDRKGTARAFLRLANLDNEIFERLGRYEARLWSRVLQTLDALVTARRQGLALKDSAPVRPDHIDEALAR